MITGEQSVEFRGRHKNGHSATSRRALAIISGSMCTTAEWICLARGWESYFRAALKGVRVQREKFIPVFIFSLAVFFLGSSPSQVGHGVPISKILSHRKPVILLAIERSRVHSGIPRVKFRIWLAPQFKQAT